MKLVEVILQTEKDFSNRDAEKLRGYIGKKFKEIITFHNHIDEVTFNYDFSFIQYKIINKKPCIMGIDKGADILLENINEITEINIDNEITEVQPLATVYFPKLEIEDKFYRYKFETFWFALNSENYKKYKEGKLDLNTQLANNILEFFKMCKVWADKKIIVKGDFKEKIIVQKDTKIKGFYGEFFVNVNLPDNISLGKRKSIGLGRIKKI